MEQRKLPISVSTSDGMHIDKPLAQKQKIITAIGIFYGNIAFGCAFNTYGPSITSLQNKYETDDATISTVFSILTGCYMIGALLAGIIFNYVNRQLTIVVILGSIAAMMLLTPHCPTITLYFVTAAVVGICSGCYDTAQIVWMMEMMQKDCPPYVQCQHFCYALGANLGSLIMAPFLSGEETDTTTPPDTTSSNDKTEYAQLIKPYTIVAFMLSISVVYNCIVFIFFRYHPPPPETIETEMSETSKLTNFTVKVSHVAEKKRESSFGVWSWPKLRMVVLICCFCGAYQSMELCTFQFFPKFGQNSDLHLSESASTYVLTGMTASYAIGRAISIIAIFKISGQYMLCGNLVLIVIANILLFGWARNSINMLWASGIIFGIGFSSVYASFTSYVERYIYFTNFIGSMMLVCGSGVAAIYPLIVGSFIEQNPIVLSYTSFFSIVILIFSFGTLSYLTHKNKTRYL